MNLRAVAVASLGLYLAQIILANLAVQYLGAVPVGFGLVAPAGVYFIGLAMVLRDQVHDRLGLAWVLGAIIAGAVLSAALGAGPRLAVASGVSFLLAELLDLAVYVPARTRWGLGPGVLLSGLFGTLLDSWLFLTLAFGSLALFPGQVVAKLTMTALGAAALVALRQRRMA